ncbi:MAG: hypothetical protein FJ271_22670 [Planctomycetes bacterium]|nr:hypothetical protein [Planctomycetota bacterium]
MNARTLALLAVAVVVKVSAGDLHADELVLVDKGKPRAIIVAPGENEWAGKRLADRLLKLTGARVTVQTDVQLPASPPWVIAIGTTSTNPIVKAVLGGDERIAGLGEEGYVLKAGRCSGVPVLVASGKTLTGVNHAVSELVSWKLKLGDGRAAVDSRLDESDKPALAYRMIWTWDAHCNWSNTIPEMLDSYVVKGNHNTGSWVVPYTREGFRTHFTRAIDYLSDHKLNGFIVWGFLREEHGGVEIGREISRYARQNNVRILPGVCSQYGYGGFIYSTTNKFNLDVWCKRHPELQGRDEKGNVVPGMLNPLKPENQKWLRDGTEWLLTNLPDIGGINLENGDFASCYAKECRAERAKPENDPNCFWDMMATQKPILEVAKKMRPDGWMTFASYVGFTEPTARGVSKTSVYPPKFVQQMPDNAICQWTFSSMTTPETWPEDARPPRSSFRGQFGLLHHGSLWGLPMDPARWWAAPGAAADDFSTLYPFVCGRIAKSGLGGLAITSQTGVQSPAHELNYTALEYFGWHPERTYAQFQKDRLQLCYGGAERAELFLKLLRNTTKNPDDIAKDRDQAVRIGRARNLDVRQRARWRNLADELARRQQLARAFKK